MEISRSTHAIEAVSHRPTYYSIWVKALKNTVLVFDKNRACLIVTLGSHSATHTRCFDSRVTTVVRANGRM